jgi:ATP/maltotriose-dependent transcriptional regulator MalT/DNA-binding SARP family transcriptional activator
MLAPSFAAANQETGRAAQPLLPLKLTPPPPRDGVLLRPDLQALLPEIRVHPLTLVVAPAGYGKTTLLAQWAQDLSRTSAAVCWLTLDSSERAPALFLAYLIRSFQTMFPQIGADAWRVLHSAANIDRDWPLVAGALCSDLQRSLLTATFLILDDLHLASDSAVIGQILGYLLRAAPPALHVISAARRAPTFAPIARLRTEGRLLELSQRDLLLSADDARQVLAAQGVQLAEPELALLLARTEGWALSVQLAARALADQPAERRGDFLRTLSGGQEQILSYLATEVLAELPQEVIEFLRLAALPAYFDAALLGEVLLREDVPYLLRRAQALGLPILPLDEQGDRLRFHPLWREMLLRGLSDTIDAETLAALHGRLGRALEARGDLEAALDHYASAGATGDLARALRERAWPLLLSPRRDTIRRWLEQLPAGMRERDPELLYIWGMSQVAAEPDQATAAIEGAAELYHQAGRFDRELRALADLAALLFWQARAADFVALCVRAVRAANRVRDAWSRGATLACVTALLYTKGRYAAALRVARRADAHPLSPSWRWLLSMIVAAIDVQLGRPDEAVAAIEAALLLPQVDQDDRLRQNLLRQRAMALYEQGQVAEALALALAAHRHLGDYYRTGVTSFSAQQLAFMLALEGRVDEAATYVAQARAAFHEMGAQAPLAGLQAIEVYAQFVRGQDSRARAAAGSVLRRLQEAGGDTPDLRLWLLLALVFGESGEHQRALALAQDIAQQMRRQGYHLFLAVAELYSAYLAGACGDTAARREALRRGWELVAAGDVRFLPMLPAAALRDVALAALREGVAVEAVGRVLRRQAPDHARELLEGLLGDGTPAVRANAARLLGDLGAAAAYPALRALLKDRSPAVRQAAEDALGRLVYRPPYTLRIRTLGAFALWRGDQEVRDRDWRSSKARQLFQLLLTERGRALPRDRVLDALWPEMEADAAANNLRVTVNRLTKALEPDRPDGAPPTYVGQQGETYSFNTASDHQIDTTEFAAAVAEGQRAERRGQRQAAVAAFRKAIEFYGGPYLPDNMYEDWTVVERERLAMLFNDAAIRLGALLLDEGAAHEVIGLAWRVLENEPAYEDAYRLLMRAHATLGERSTALRLYARCATILRDELGVEPLPETTALYHALREMR